MKDRKKLENKFGKSKGFGFVAFVEHIHALKALRHLNNNPNIFTPQKRPIVEFSIENKVALNKKKHREKGNKMRKNNSSLIPDDKVEEQSTIPYSGVQSRPANKSEKIKAPKVNRKLTEMKNQLKVRGKKLQLNKIKANNEKRHKEKLENRKLNKTQIIETDDIHDEHYRKRKNIFKTDNNDAVINSKAKKRKWFYNTHK
jgi:nucleolar protein 4